VVSHQNPQAVEVTEPPENSPQDSPQHAPRACQAIFVYGLLSACTAVIALSEDVLSTAIAFSILYWVGFGFAVVFAQLKVPRPRPLHQQLYWAMWWPWYRKRHAKGPGDRS
jgi:hypothetical protein